MIAMQSINTILEALTYHHQFRDHTLLIKLGGSILHDPQRITLLCQDLKLLRGAGMQIVLVHGGSKAIKHYLNRLAIDTDVIDGLRVTSEAAMEIVEMVLCGHVNKLLVRKLNSIGTPAVGLTGSDNNLLQCDYYSHEHGCTGKVISVNIEAVQGLLLQQKSGLGLIPVIAPVGVGREGQAMNINADIAACHLAIALSADKLIYLTDQAGICDETGKCYSQLNATSLLRLIKTGVASGGMRVKAQAILMAMENHVNAVHVLNGNRPHVLIEELFTVNGVGTLCQN